MHEHTQRLLASSAQWLRDAAVETLSESGRISAAVVGGYNILQAVQAPYPGKLEDHPLASIVTAGAEILGLSKPDLELGLALVEWDGYGRYQLEPAPASAEAALAWATRIWGAALKLQGLQ
jgi:hypothetical protein